MYVKQLRHAAIIALILLSACKKDKKPGGGGNNKNVEVYLTGSLQTSNFYWKNGDMQKFDAGNYRSAIAFDNNDIYVAGYTGYPFDVVYWKNDEVHQLGFRGMANEIAISGGNVYTAGYYDGKLWYAKNTERTFITAGDAYLNGFVVDGDDVYMAVAAHAYGSPRYYKNTTAVPLPLPAGFEYAYTHDVAIKDNEVHVVGEGVTTDGKIKAIYWKNSVPAVLNNGTTDAQALRVKTAGNDVYIAGAVKNAAGMYVIHCWKNGQLLFTADKAIRSYCTDMSIVGTDVYISGVTGRESGVKTGPTSLPAYWKNTEKHVIANEGFEVGYAYNIAVREK